MTVPIGIFSLLIVLALLVVAVSPFILLALWVADLRKGALW
jgi:hypothetical protein